MIRILLVDDQKAIRASLKALLEPEPDFEVVGTADNGHTAVKQVEILRPDVVLIDMEMPGLDGVSTTKIISERFPNTKVLVLSGHDKDEYVNKSLGAGATGYLLKDTPHQDLKQAIRYVYRGYAQIGPGLLEKMIPLAQESRSLTQKSTSIKSPPQTSSGTKKNLVPSEELSNRSSISPIAKPKSPSPKFEQGVVLRQSPLWSQAIIWTIIGVASFGIGWASIAKIEQVVPAKGQLKPQGKVKEVQAPVNGVVQEVYVEDGDRVEKGQKLVSFDSTAAEAQLKSLENIRQSLRQENQFYRALMQQAKEAAAIEGEIARLNLPKEVTFLVRNRVALVEENQLFRALLAGSSGNNLKAEQRAYLRATQSELNSRKAAARLEVEQLRKQLDQNQVQLADAQARLSTERQIRDEMEPLATQGAIARLQYLQQQQEVQSRIAEVDQLREEQKRLRFDIAQGMQEWKNTVDVYERDLRERLANNQKQIAEIDSQLTKIIVENEKRLSETDSEISQTQVTLKYQQLRAPVTGTVFDLQAGEGFVPNPSQAEPLLKIVPDDHLVAEVFITNEDIGFVRSGMKTDVRIDSFPFSEFGDIKGKVLSIGSDALPPDELHQFYRFPAEVSLDQQFLEIKDKEIPLQSGMSVSVNIKVREERTVLSLFTELFTKKVESLKQVR